MRTKQISDAPPEMFQGWEKLEPNEQTKITVETHALEKAANTLEMSNLEIGEHLDNISLVLAPKRQFNKWLLWWLDSRKRAKSRSWAYQALAEYQAIKNHIPKPVLEVAKERGVKLSPLVLAQNPPPKTQDKGKILEYVNNLKPSRVEIAKSPETLLKECVNFVGTRWAQLPNNHKTRTAFMRSLLGMLLGKFGVASEQSFAPMAIPDNFKVQRGRPKAA
jgi:hypothetical protein